MRLQHPYSTALRTPRDTPLPTLKVRPFGVCTARRTNVNYERRTQKKWLTSCLNCPTATTPSNPPSTKKPCTCTTKSTTTPTSPTSTPPSKSTPRPTPASLEELLANLDSVPEDIRRAVRNNAGGHSNHSMFWQIMGPSGQGGGEPTGELAYAIDSSFGSFEGFKEQWAAAAAPGASSAAVGCG